MLNFASIEKSIINFKEKCPRKVLGIIYFCIFGAVVLFAMVLLNKFKIQKQATEDNNNRDLYELVGYAKNIEVYIEKARVVTTPKATISTFCNIVKQASLAKETLSSLPIDQNNMNQISKYFTQVIDYSTVVIEKVSTNNKLADEDYSNLDKINEYALHVSNVFTDIYAELNAGNINWNELSKIANEKLEIDQTSSTLKGFTDLKNTFTEYEGLIYDGAYSNHLETSSPKLIQYLPECTVEEAKTKVKECILNKYTSKEKVDEDIIQNIQFVEETNGKLPLYTFNVIVKKENMQDTVYVQITKKGGLMYLMLSDKTVSEAKIDIEEAKVLGREYLNKIGISNMKATYYINTDNMLTINYAYVQNDVIIYTDLIKVKIALDTGEIYSAECAGYIFNHTTRENISPVISDAKAKEVLNSKIEVKATNLAIIPNELNEEILTYEFKGVVEEREYLAYINAKTGEEENILIILETEGGILTM
jgi:germination protein YpeB